MNCIEATSYKYVSGKDRKYSSSISMWVALQPQPLTYQQPEWAVKQDDIKTPAV